MAERLVPGFPTRWVTCVALILVLLSPGPPGPAAALEAPGFPSWAFHLKLWPFDILLPDTGQGEILERLDGAVTAGANATIVYIEEEHMYGTFVDETGFAGILESLRYLVTGAHDRGLKVIVYLNGLEVMTRNAIELPPVPYALTDGQ